MITTVQDTVERGCEDLLMPSDLDELYTSCLPAKGLLVSRVLEGSSTKFAYNASGASISKVHPSPSRSTPTGTCQTEVPQNNVQECGQDHSTCRMETQSRSRLQRCRLECKLQVLS